MSVSILTRPAYEVVVIGGGLLGAAIAYGLARLGLKTAMVDEGDIAHRAARGNTSLVWVQGKGYGCPAYAAWTVRAAEAWPVFAAELKELTGVDVNYRRTGGLKFCLDDREFECRHKLIDGIEPESPGARSEMLDRQALLDIYPEIGPQVAGASYNPMDGQVNSLLLWRALHQGFQQLSGHYLPRHSVGSICQIENGFELVTANGSVQAERILLTAGVANVRFAAQVGLRGGVRPVRGQVLVSEKLQSRFPVPATDLVQTDTGGLLIGNVEEDAGFDESTNIRVLASMARRAVATFPSLETVQLVRSWAALRVMTEDGNPLYQRSDSHPRAFAASTHSGVTLTPLHATMLARWIAGLEIDPAIADFGPEQRYVH